MKSKTETIYRKIMNLDEVRAFIEAQSEETRFYIGGDSERFRIDGTWYAEYTVVVVVHYEGCKGAKLFGEVTREKDYDQQKNRPALRLMTEVYKISEMFLKLQDILKDRYVEIHMDINPNEIHGSSCVLQQAIGYIKGTCNIVPMVKPNAWSASFAADRYTSLRLKKAVA
jgi:predicted RNase H-related nuclease YkuK (DUF458 family)